MTETMQLVDVVELETKLYVERDFDAVADLYAEDIELVLVDGPVLRTREEVVDYLKREEEAFSDASLTWEILAVDGPTVVQAWTWSSRHTGDLTLPSSQAFTAAGREVTIEAVSVSRIEGGRLKYSRRYYDRFGVLSQLGMVPG